MDRGPVVDPVAAPDDAAGCSHGGGRTGDFEVFYARWSPDALRYAWTVAGPAAAEDACQDAWERIWRHWDSAEPARREAWALRIVRNCCLDRLRAGARLIFVAEPDPGASGDAEGEAITRLELDRSLALLSSLAPPLRETLWLREVGDLTYAEIAEFCGVPLGTVMSRLHAARRKMSRLLR